MDRISKQRWWMELAHAAAKRSEDPWCKVGAVGVREDGSIAGVSYNGAPPKINLKEIWLDRDERRKFVVHAETNLLRYIKPKECKDVSVTLCPCFDCMKNLASYGIETVFFSEFYDKCDIQEIIKMSRIFNIALYKMGDSIDRIDGYWLRQNTKKFIL
jgi:dCMP deaminase